MELMKRSSSDINNKNIENTTNSEVLSAHNAMRIDTVDNMEEKGSKLQRYWISFIDMAKLLLHLISPEGEGVDIFSLKLFVT